MAKTGTSAIKLDRLHLWGNYAPPAATVVERARACRATDVVRLVNDYPSAQPAYGMRGSVDAYKKIIDALHTANIGPALCTWLDPTEKYIAAAAAELVPLCNETGVRYLAFDLEGEWRKRQASGTHAEFVSRVLAPAFADLKCPIVITSFALLPGDVAPAVKWAMDEHDGAGSGQVYSGWRNDQEKAAAGTLSPANLPARSWESWGKVCGASQIPIYTAFARTEGAGAGFRAFPGYTPASTLRTQLEEATRLGVREAGLWVEGALFGQGGEAMRAVLAEAEVTGEPAIWAPGVSGGKLAVGAALTAAAAATAYATRKRWLPVLRRVFGWRAR